ncbi:MAG: hypothetical protein NZ954_05065 [Thermofilaceae archaeon]|nr:hypothetical protein [Thermofilaceae archaeon]MCX8180177.1 hypothetical protein [Thermofilaceae archaeon]MDW8004167.1 hypothetical protein [Thermofilaceae archaeon]
MKLNVLLNDRSFGLEITVSRVEDLHPHEEVIPSHLEHLIRAFKDSLYQRNPVIVDSSSNIVLDGTHRWAVMRALNYEWIATCNIDYCDPLVELDSWSRLFRPPRDINLDLSKVLEGLEIEPISFQEIGNRDLVVIIYNNVLRIRFREILEAFKKLRFIEEKLTKLTESKPSYVLRTSVERHSRSGIVVLPPRPYKEEVVKIVREGHLFPPKSTRHVVPARPMGVNIPLKFLRSKLLDIELVEEFLRQRSPLLLRPPVLLDREYQEAIIYFI